MAAVACACGECGLPRPISGRTACLRYLERAVAPEPLADVLSSLVVAGAIRGYRIDGAIVRLDADSAALELSVLRASGDDSESDRLGDDVERGFSTSSDIGGRRGSPTARAADFGATRSYYARAQGLLRDPSLPVRARRIWVLHAEGVSDDGIARRLGMTRRRVVAQLAVLRYKAGLTKEVRGWATSNGW